MKKILLSMLLALLCQVTANAGPCHDPNPHDGCIKTINGVQYLVFTVSCLDPGQSVAIWYMSTMGVSPGIVPCSTSYHPISGNLMLYYCINPAFPLLRDANGCVHYTWSQAWNGNFPPFPPGATFQDKICPCPPCDARFSYCVKNDGNQWLVSLNMLTLPGSPEIDLIVDGVVTNYPNLSNPLSFVGGSHTICIRVWDTERTVYCEYCVNTCLGEEDKSPVQSMQSGQFSTAFSKVKIYPNPASSTAKLELNLLEEQQLTIELIDISGRVVSKIKDEKALAGYHAIDISTTGMPSGIYIVRMRTGQTIANYRLSVIK